MTNQEAISVIKNRIKLPDGNTYEKMCEREYQQEALNLAISALRAQEKEPCEFCKGTHYTERKAILDNREFELLIDTDNTICVFCKESKDLDEVKINFCPMCGRPLKGEGNGTAD